jgi:Kef-type K+ transport system membrane component KefB
VGLEGIIGAFFAGLALNRLVPSGGELMENVEFVGAVLLVPFFLLSTGMLLDPAQFTEADVLVIAGASLAIVVVGKAAASYVSGRLSGLDKSEIRLVFGLTVPQAAATLAAVTIGVDVGIFDEELLSAALVVVLVTVVVGGLVTRGAARALDRGAHRALRCCTCQRRERRGRRPQRMIDRIGGRASPPEGLPASL